MAARRKTLGAKTRYNVVAFTKVIVTRGEKALAALWLSATTQADRVRCAQVERAFQAIDREQASFKEAVDAILSDAQDAFKGPWTGAHSGYSKLSSLHQDLLDKLETVMAPTRIKEKKDGQREGG